MTIAVGNGKRLTRFGLGLRLCFGVFSNGMSNEMSAATKGAYPLGTIFQTAASTKNKLGNTLATKAKTPKRCGHLDKIL